MEGVGTSEMEIAAEAVIAAAAGVAAGVESGSTATAGSAGRDPGAAGPQRTDLPAVAVALAAAVGSAAEVSDPVRPIVGTRVVPEGPVDSGDQDPVVAAAAAVEEERRKVAVLNGTVGAGYRGAVLQRVHGALEIVGMGALAAHAGQEVERGGPAECREQQSRPGWGQNMRTAAGRGEGAGHADCSSPGSVGRRLLDPAVRRQTSRQETGEPLKIKSTFCHRLKITGLGFPSVGWGSGITVVPGCSDPNRLVTVSRKALNCEPLVSFGSFISLKTDFIESFAPLQF